MVQTEGDWQLKCEWNCPHNIPLLVFDRDVIIGEHDHDVLVRYEKHQLSWSKFRGCRVRTLRRLARETWRERGGAAEEPCHWVAPECVKMYTLCAQL
jgi:hypothetical protein